MDFVKLRPLIAFAGGAILFALCYFFFIPQSKIVYVDSSKLFNGYKGMLDARKDFEAKHNVWQANIDTLAKGVNDAIKKYSNDLATGTDRVKLISKEYIQNKQKELVDYQNAVKQNAAQEQDRLNQNVFSTVNAYLQRYGKKNGFKMILIAANGNIGYADESTDITDKIVEELNKEYSGGTNSSKK